MPISITHKGYLDDSMAHMDTDNIMDYNKHDEQILQTGMDFIAIISSFFILSVDDHSCTYEGRTI